MSGYGVAARACMVCLIKAKLILHIYGVCDFPSVTVPWRPEAAAG